MQRRRAQRARGDMCRAAQLRVRPFVPHVVQWRPEASFRLAEHDAQPIRFIMIDIRGGNQAVVKWINGRWCCFNPRVGPPLRRAMRVLRDLSANGSAIPAEAGGDWLRHELRRGNAVADELAGKAARRHCTEYCSHDSARQRFPAPGRTVYLRCFLQGSLKGQHAVAGCSIEIWLQDGAWHQWKTASVFLGCVTSATAELVAASTLIDFLAKMVSCRTPADMNDKSWEDDDDRRPRTLRRV
ncbi:unnamed protein product [Prorocentrum cordatum]|uniref:Uncharacterized protein n=1 Tax=Prorocentrum cordatum TaxID=2364126 RepID=A0ABN9TMA1_9DINO|nr:unnamed protein product [Polarella glacialis]